MLLNHRDSKLCLAIHRFPCLQFTLGLLWSIDGATAPLKWALLVNMLTKKCNHHICFGGAILVHISLAASMVAFHGVDLMLASRQFGWFAVLLPVCRLHLEDIILDKG